MSSLNKIKEFPYIFYCNFQRSKKYNNVQDGNIYIKFVHYQEQHRWNNKTENQLRVIL